MDLHRELFTLQICDQEQGGSDEFELKMLSMGGVESEIPYYVIGLINKYDSIFKEPLSLPPMR